VFREAEDQGLPEPHIEEIGIRFRFTVFLKEGFRRGVVVMVQHTLKNVGVVQVKATSSKPSWYRNGR